MDPKICRCTILISRARNLKAADSNGYSDPFVKCHVVDLHDAKKREQKFKTETIQEDLNPVWNAIWEVDIRPECRAILRIFDRDKGVAATNDFLGEISFSFGDIVEMIDDEEAKSGYWYALDKGKRKKRVTGDLFLGINVEPIFEYQMNTDYKINEVVQENKLERYTQGDVMKILEDMNFPISTRVLEKNFKLLDPDDNGHINKSQLTQLCKRLFLRNSITEVFYTFTEADTSFMMYHNFEDFIVNVQSDNLPEEEIRALFEKYAGDDDLISASEFSSFMTSMDNSFTDPAKLALHQDMDRPINEYYINSSHNTYLLGGQVLPSRKTSSYDAYESALRKGCRCVELDCWDVSGGKDVKITHGNTFVSALEFTRVLKTIKRWAFEASEYPVILSLEVHCQEKGKNFMADNLVEIFGEMLALPQENQQPGDFTPEKLKGKILLKATVDSSRLGDIITIPSIKIQDGDILNKWEDNKSFHSAIPQPWAISSIEESIASRYTKTEYRNLVECNSRQLTRIYPSGLRTDSSNYDPIPFWFAGCQVVALNFQTKGLSTWMNAGKFDTNGGTGYVLKPLRLRAGPNSKFNKPEANKWAITMRILDGYKIPGKEKGIKRTRTGSPYIRIFVNGPGKDFKFETKKAKHNILNPTFDEMFKFKLRSKVLSSIIFIVMIGDKAVAYFSAQVSNLRNGYRHLPLRNKKGQLLTESSLFVHMSLQKQEDPKVMMHKFEERYNEEFAELQQENRELSEKVSTLEERLARMEELVESLAQ
eukprot:TRINITY_DN1871_c0_g1_i1.p1 TRINITY_DN1871_c0_g1~~TRINITY_DN1871_c0_g1_i1.p1  ORF type:complete len:765 (+),score=175.01 TRINITY_DN1871_c0_g1_i1:225-2519(+)